MLSLKKLNYLWNSVLVAVVMSKWIISNFNLSALNEVTLLYKSLSYTFTILATIHHDSSRCDLKSGRLLVDIVLLSNNFWEI